MNDTQLCKYGMAVVEIEAKAVLDLKSRIDEHFAHACQLLLACQGRIIVTGIGKSGHIARKVAATFASTGSPAIFVHAAEASHGDLGMITMQDVVIAISNSGETAEIIGMLPLIKRLDIPLISLSGVKNSTLANAATAYLNTSVAEEACPLGLAPSSSTTATLVMGDALAIALLQAKGFTAQDFATYHPGGRLGRRLLMRVEDIMRTGQFIPKVHEEAGLDTVLIEMTQKSLGMTTLVEDDGQLKGIYTDGDLRRTLNRGMDVHATKIKDVMTKNAKIITADKLAAEALHLMETYKITALTVTNHLNQVIGVIHMHDLLTAGIA